ncbi:MAG: DUF4241 domain-containing protein [Planctomycetes bacterium]|nr:DUF4241 domain-containing protein [Planctomycetota bacterium]
MDQAIKILNVFDSQEEMATRYGRVDLEKRVIDDVLITTGTMVVCDPTFVRSGEWIEIAVSPGDYPVELCIAHTAGTTDQRIAAARVKFDNGPIKTVTKTTPPDFEVEGGSACFMDKLIAQKLRNAEEKDWVAYLDSLRIRMHERYVPTWSWCSMIIDSTSGENALIFDTGWGDGMYPIYIGLNAHRRPAVLVADFLLDVFIEP